MVVAFKNERQNVCEFYALWGQFKKIFSLVRVTETQFGDIRFLNFRKKLRYRNGIRKWFTYTLQVNVFFVQRNSRLSNGLQSPWIMPICMFICFKFENWNQSVDVHSVGGFYNSIIHCRRNLSINRNMSREHTSKTTLKRVNARVIWPTFHLFCGSWQEP